MSNKLAEFYSSLQPEDKELMANILAIAFNDLDECYSAENFVDDVDSDTFNMIREAVAANEELGARMEHRSVVRF